MRPIDYFFVMMFIALVAGCWSLPEARALVLSDFRTDVLSRAAFELDCAVDRVQITDLTPKNRGLMYSSVGVTGCGRKAVYVYVFNQGWVNNGGASERQ